MRALDVLGRRGEEVAAGYFATLGMQLSDGKWRCPECEIGIAVLDDGTGGPAIEHLKGVG